MKVKKLFNNDIRFKYVYFESESGAVWHRFELFYFPLGLLLPLAGPDGLPVLLGQLGLLVLLVKLAFVTLIS